MTDLETLKNPHSLKNHPQNDSKACCKCIFRHSFAPFCTVTAQFGFVEGWNVKKVE
jgi:hypothetical protein